MARGLPGRPVIPITRNQLKLRLFAPCKDQREQHPLTENQKKNSPSPTKSPSQLRTGQTKPFDRLRVCTLSYAPQRRWLTGLSGDRSGARLAPSQETRQAWPKYKTCNPTCAHWGVFSVEGTFWSWLTMGSPWFSGVDPVGTFFSLGCFPSQLLRGMAAFLVLYMVLGRPLHQFLSVTRQFFSNEKGPLASQYLAGMENV